MNISFDGTISNTLPNDESTFFKRSRCELGLVQDTNKRVRRAPSPTPVDGAMQNMLDDSAATLDELADTLREVNQRLDQSLRLSDSSMLDFSSSNFARRGVTGMNHSHSRLHFSSSSLQMPLHEAAPTNSAPLLATRGPPPLVNFRRIPRGSADDRL
ncbi:expressed unknown protein [Seminavis robusta]|uniref:Uncharacterized protein n=1 Tax=Seminavis robusta TaxID=568900 RepID=A0A9N8DQH4_9STRA|nr:expressed unknown protein [Seminavis robusta]|eukprot:Sro267_g103380.1 n/a (157) ;mRNA; r:31649-32119